jgi:multidrug efflux pump subunit AcrA (membrane-fusion protein)
MTTTVGIDLMRHENVLALPIRALRREKDRRFVLVRRGGTIERQPITPGVRDENYWEIVDGLREGDEVILGNRRQNGAWVAE